MKLSELLQTKGYIRGPFGSALVRSQMLKTGIPVYEQENAIDDNRNFRYFIDEYKYNELKRFTVHKNDLLISCSGNVGKVTLIKETDPLGIISQALLILRPNIQLIDPEYFLYYFRSPLGYSKLTNASQGSVQLNIAPRAVVEQIEIDLPDIPTQKRIAGVLSALDEKINNNNKTITSLELLSKTIYKHWFRDFDFPDENGRPYRSSGGKMIESEVGKIPEIWRVGKLKEHISNIIDNRGKTPPIVENIGNNCYPVIEVNSLVGDRRCLDINLCKKYVNSETYRNWFRAGHPQTGDILISTVGSLGAICQVNNEKVCIAQNIIGLRPKYTSEYLYQLLINKKDEIIGLDISSVQPSIKVPHILDLTILIPDNRIEDLFEKSILNYSANIHNLNKQNNYLSTVKSLLLPKLFCEKLKIN